MSHLVYGWCFDLKLSELQLVGYTVKPDEAVTLRNELNDHLIEVGRLMVGFPKCSINYGNPAI